MSLNQKQLEIYNSILSKLNQAVEGTMDGQPDTIKNPIANCLIKSAIYDLILLNHLMGN